MKLVLTLCIIINLLLAYFIWRDRKEQNESKAQTEQKKEQENAKPEVPSIKDVASDYRPVNDRKRGRCAWIGGRLHAVGDQVKDPPGRLLVCGENYAIISGGGASYRAWRGGEPSLVAAVSPSPSVNPIPLPFRKAEGGAQ